MLARYDVGESTNPKAQLFNRVVVPIYDQDYKEVVGCTGRAIIENNPEGKWKNTVGTQTSQHLYNYWFSLPEIKKKKTVIIVEGPPDIWRLEEAGIHNAVALFGTNLSDRQRILLEISGAMMVKLALDNDEAGRLATSNIEKMLHYQFNIKKINFIKKDAGETSHDELRKLLL